MKSIILHADGSFVHEGVLNKQGKWLPMISWGIVALYDDTEVELSGKRTACNLGQKHEIVAFFESVLYAHSHGFAPNQTTIFTDCDSLGRMAVSLHPENYISQRMSDLRLLCAVAKDYNIDVLNLVITYLLEAHVQFVTGLNRGLYHARADYLARQIRKSKSFVPFIHWIKMYAKNKSAWKFIPHTLTIGC